MSIISLLTDFGNIDEYVGVMKGVILSVNPCATIVDISHNVGSQDIVQAAYLIESAYKFFPKKTVHVIVVDPGVGTKRAILAVKLKDHFFLAPDNGVLSLILEKRDVESIIKVENQKYFLDCVSPTFHGRDIFAPVAAHISKGVQLEKFGPLILQQDVKRINLEKPYVSYKGELVGAIISVDRFGNLITNIKKTDLNHFIKNRKKKVVFQVGGCEIGGLSEKYTDVKPNKPLVITGSRGYIEIALNCGDASCFFSAKQGDIVKISIKR